MYAETDAPSGRVARGLVPELTTLAELTPAAIGAWADLALQAEDPNPFLHPEFVLAAARSEGLLGSVSLLTVRGADEMLAALPVRHSHRWRHVPLRSTLAWTHDQCFLGTPLVARGSSHDSLAVLLGDLGARCSGSFAELDLVCDAGPLARTLDDVLPQDAVVFGRFSRATLERRQAGDYLEGRLRGKHRRALRRLARELESELGGELELVERAGRQDAVEEFLHVEAEGWKGEAGTALASDPRRADFFRSICRDFAARGALQLLFLEAGGRTVAARVNLRAGGTIFCFKIAHDETLGRYSPGMQLELRMIEHFHADLTAQRMDSCTDPASEMFNRLWPDRRELRTLLLPAAGLTGRVARPMLRAAGMAIDRHRGGPSPAVRGTGGQA